MPRENRKRGKKHKKRSTEEDEAHQQYGTQLEDQHTEDAEPQAGPSWIVSALEQSPDVNPEAPFGYVDAEVKAYFRTVDLQIREWQEQRENVEDGDEDSDPNEDRGLFFVAALTEMSGKEKQLATDPDCSTILERMTYSMDDFARRVFVDRLSGSFEQLVKHRFASHVCQTLFTVASDTVARECRGALPSASESPEDGELRSLTQLVLDACEELLPSLPSLIMDPFASHVIRALLLLLAPDCFSLSEDHLNGSRSSGLLRSKRSAAYKARQGPMKSVFLGDETNQKNRSAKQSPMEFHTMAQQLVNTIREKLDDNEVRALAADKVACPVLQILIEIEAEYSMSDSSGSLMDRTLVGLITLSHEDTPDLPDASDYLMTLLRDQTASHLLESLVRRAPESVFNILWSIHFNGKLQKLAIHPVANFVVAKALERVSADQLGEVCQELDGAFGKIIKNSRLGVLRALVDRAADLRAHEAQVVDAICAAFNLAEEESRTLAVPCILRLQTLEVKADYKVTSATKAEKSEENQSNPQRRQRRKPDDDPMEPKTQGALLLQSMLRLSASHNNVVLDSIQSLNIDELLAMGQHATSSRVLDVVLESPTVPAKAKRKFILTFLGHFHRLVDDRIGSRVGERCWASADPYLKEKIARSLIPHEPFLSGSFYGKFFARHLDLHILKRDPEQWKDRQVATKHQGPQASGREAAQASAPVPATPVTTAAPAQTQNFDVTEERDKKRRRKRQLDDEIDELFDSGLGKKIRKCGLGPRVEDKTDDKESGGTKTSTDIDLKDVLGAIRSAPKDDGPHRKKKRKH